MADVVSRTLKRGSDGAYSLDEPPVEHQTALSEVGGKPKNKLDSDEARTTHRQLMSWYYYERERQAANRMEMAMDHDFYDGDQWSDEDKAVLAERGQMPLVYNEVAPMCDWMIGTERRARVDWKILPRTEDDVEKADIKTKVLKYVSDVNSAPFQRSRAFSDAVKGGLGWIDDGIRDDPTKEILYSRYEDWRNVLMDSSGLDIVGEDARYIYRWRWVDEDIAIMMFPDRADKIRAATEDWAFGTDGEDDELQSWQSPLNDAGRRLGTATPLGSGTTGADAQRRRVKLIECQWRAPTPTKFVKGGPMSGLVYDERDSTLAEALKASGGKGVSIIDKVVMRVHVAVMTESALLAMGPSVYRHNQFSLTPVVCYRRGRDRQWYGAIRRVRDIQMDLNKRASKALWLLNTNQLLAEEGAFKDIEQAREEAQDPQGVLIYKAGKQIDIRRDTDAATGQMQIMAMDQQAIQRGAGVTDENLGRKTNAVSGEAIKARQIQGSVVTTEPYDNLRMAAQAQGSKQLSLVEQFFSEEKVIRLTGAQGAIEWLKINQPEVQADGTVRWLNDITDSVADFIVSEADYAGTLRQVMFDSLMQLSQRLPPELAVRMLRMAFQYSDLPNKNEIADEIRRLSGDPDPTKKLSPEEQAAQERQQAMQEEAVQMQRAQAAAALEEQQAKVREINARAEKLLAEAAMQGSSQDGAMQSRIEAAVAAVREQAQTQIDTMSRQLAKMTASNEAEILKIKTEADTADRVARIQANAQIQVAEISKPSDDALQQLQERMSTLEKMSADSQKPAAKK